MKCIAVYTNNFEVFSDIYEKVLSMSLGDSEEAEVEGVMVSEAGSVPEHYVDRLRHKPDVVIMKEKDRDITILQRGQLFEILIPENQFVVN
jgi:hypothetical protein